GAYAHEDDDDRLAMYQANFASAIAVDPGGHLVCALSEVNSMIVGGFVPNLVAVSRERGPDLLAGRPTLAYVTALHSPASSRDSFPYLDVPAARDERTLLEAVEQQIGPYAHSANLGQPIKIMWPWLSQVIPLADDSMLIAVREAPRYTNKNAASA